MSRFTRKLSQEKADVLQRMANEDFSVLGQEMDRRREEEYETGLVKFVKNFGKNALTDEHKIAFEKIYGEEEYTNEELETQYLLRDWSMQPQVLKSLYKSATVIAKNRYKLGERA